MVPVTVVGPAGRHLPADRGRAGHGRPLLRAVRRPAHHHAPSRRPSTCPTWSRVADRSRSRSSSPRSTTGSPCSSTDPDVMTVELDALKTVIVPVMVEHGTVPEGLELGDTTVEPDERRGSRVRPSVIDQVVAARADVAIQPSGHRHRPGRPARARSTNSAMRSARSTCTPSTARVGHPGLHRPPVADAAGQPGRDRARRLPGSRSTASSVTPSVVTVEGDADELVALDRIDTVPVSVAGACRRTGRSRSTWSCRAGSSRSAATAVDVTITLRPVTATRSFEVGLQLVGADPDLVYRRRDRPGPDHGRRVGRGSRPAGRGDARRRPGRRRARRPGTRDVPVTRTCRPGLTLVSASPPRYPSRSARASPSPTVADRGSPASRPPPEPREADRCHDCSAPTASAGSPTSTSSRPLAYALGRATAQPLAGPGGVDRRRSGHAPLRGHVRRRHHGRGDQPGRRRPRRRRGADAGPRLPRADRSVRRRDHGLSLAQPGRRQRPQGPRRPRAEARRRRSRRSSSSSSGARASWPASGNAGDGPADRCRRARSATTGPIGMAWRRAVDGVGPDASCSTARTGPAVRSASRSWRATGAAGRGHPRRARTE